jgi:hypothetical protein
VVVLEPPGEGILYIQGGAVNRGLQWFFSMYRPSCLIEAYGGPEKYRLVCVGLLVAHVIKLNLIFLCDGIPAEESE